RLLDRVRTELRGQQGLDLQLLLGGEREQLVGRLLRLERSFGALARGDDLGERLGIVAYVRDDAVLDVHRLAECRHRTVELTACPCDALVAGEASVEAVRKQLAIALVELIDAEADALRLAHQPVDLLETPLKLSELRKVDAREVPRLVDEHLRLVLERLYLIVDLLERARGGEQVLRVVGGIE